MDFEVVHENIKLNAECEYDKTHIIEMFGKCRISIELNTKAEE